MENQSTEKIPWRVKVYYGLLATSITLMATIGNNLALYYEDYIEVSLSLIGWAQLAFAVVNSLNDPFIGYLIDRTPQSKGRNKFLMYILLAIPFLFIGLIFQLLGQKSWPPVLIFLTLFLGYAIYDSGIAMFGISKNNIIIEGSSSNKERSSIESVSLIFQTIFGIAAFLIPTYFFTRESSQLEMILMFGGFGVVGIIFYTLSALGFRKSTDSIISKEEPKIMKNYGKTMKSMLRQRSYILFVLCGLLIVGVQANSQTFMIYYLKNFLSIEEGIITTISGIFFPLFLITYIIGPTLVKKIGIKWFLIIGQIITLAGYTGVLFGLVGYFAYFSLALTSIGGLFWWMANLALFGKIFDEFETKHGKIDKGVFMGINAIFSSPAPSLVFFVFGIIVDSMDFNTKLGIRIGMGLWPLFLIIIASILVFLLPNWKREGKVGKFE